MECRILLANTLLSSVSDHLQWHPDIVGGYSVRSGYQLLTTQPSSSIGGLRLLFGILWFP